MSREDEIRIIAYTIWQEEGCCDGQHVEHWQRAEVIWEERQAENNVANVAAKSKRTRSATARKSKPGTKKTSKK